MKKAANTPAFKRNAPFLHFFSSHTNVATFTMNGKVQQAKIEKDSHGQMYYVAGAKKNYLPKEWQPKPINS